jgi:hypothetical protein
MLSDEEEGAEEGEGRYSPPSIWVYGEEVEVKKERWRRQDVPTIQPKQTRLDYHFFKFAIGHLRFWEKAVT